MSLIFCRTHRLSYEPLETSRSKTGQCQLSEALKMSAFILHRRVSVAAMYVTRLEIIVNICHSCLPFGRFTIGKRDALVISYSKARLC
jgi:hypothetical protein